MRTLIWPEVTAPTYYQCHICRVLILPETNNDGKTQWFSPESRYWNPVDKKVYCGVDCMWKDQQK